MIYPKNRLIVNGVDLSEKFKMVLGDGYTLAPPEPKTYIIDIPGGNGSLDLTEALMGDVVYKNRKQTFTFYLIDCKNFEKAKTEISNFLHGREFDYKITMDPDYIYHGRFTVSEYSHSAYMIGIVGAIKIAVDAQPFKRKPAQTLEISAVGGREMFIESGRMRVRPTIVTPGFLRVIYDGKQLDLQKGTWNINDLLFTEGMNDIYFNSYPIFNLTWKDAKTSGITWGQLNEKPLYKWYRHHGNYVSSQWEHWIGYTWNNFYGQSWEDASRTYISPDYAQPGHITYEWGDL